MMNRRERRAAAARARRKPTKPSRSCGGCVACCHALQVTGDPLNEAGWENGVKPEWSDCAHARPGEGCAIYRDRPKGCGHFRCGWLQGYGDELDRPDRCGVVLSINKDGKIIQAIEVTRGAADVGRGAALVRRIVSLGMPVVKMHKERRTIVRPTIGGRPI